MATKLFHIPNSLSFTLFFPKPSLPKSTVLSLFSTNPSLTLTQTQTLSYGPSLLKGTKTPIPNTPQTLEEEDKIINEEQFIRIFHIAALRVPSKDCFALESRLRGHLLNWPRIRNIARAPGDDIEDDEIIDLLNKEGEEERNQSLDSLNRRINGKAEGDGERLSPVLYRDKLVKTFDARGFVRFKNLARISRPKEKRKRNEEVKRMVSGRKEFVVVEVLEEEEEEEGREEMRGLLGEGLEGGRKWKGSTRLLLLDERYKDKGVEELPMAIQVYHC